MILRFPSLAILPVLVSFALHAQAIDNSSRAAARTLVNDGVALFHAERFAEAQRKFTDALAVVEVPTVALWAARTHEKLGQWVLAAELYQRLQLMRPNELWVGDAQQQAQAQAQAGLATLSPRIPTVQLKLKGALTSDLEVTIDSVKVPASLLATSLPLDPGEHVVVATRGSRSGPSVKFRLAEGERSVVPLESPPPPADGALENPQQKPPALPPATRPELQSQATETSLTTHPKDSANHSTSSSGWQDTAGWVALGTGTAGLAVGALTTVFLAGKQKSLERDGCTPRTCPGDTFADRVDSYNAYRKISTVSFVVGTVGAAVGVTLLLTRPKHPTSAETALVVGPSEITLRGAF